MKTISRAELWAKLHRGDNLRLVMALNEWAYRAKHIPGSEHFNGPEEIFSSLSPDEEIIVYCTSPDCHASVALYWALVDAGFRGTSFGFPIRSAAGAKTLRRKLFNRTGPPRGGFVGLG